MNIHLVKAPFMSKLGQFEENKHTLCIGLDCIALESTEKYRCYLGKNRKAYFEIDTVKAFEVARKYKSFWKNRKGRVVAILPLFAFETKFVENYIPERRTDIRQLSIL